MTEVERSNTEEPASSKKEKVSDQRPYAEALALAGYLTSESVIKHLSNLMVLPESVQAEISRRLNRYSMLEQSSYQPASFTRIQEREVLDLIRQISGMLPANLENLTGFEWVEVEKLIAGRLVTGPLMPGWETLAADLQPVSVARFCLFSGMNGQLQVRIPTNAQEPTLFCDWDVSSSLQVIRVTGRQVFLRLDIQNVLDPIHVLLVNGRTIALSGLERLSVLARQGIPKALCLVSYGYGLVALEHFPTTDKDLLFAERPPLISDFANSDLVVRVPVRQPFTVIRVRPDRVSVA